MAAATEAAGGQDGSVVANWFYEPGWTDPPAVVGGIPESLFEEARGRMAYLEREHEDSRVYLFRVAQLVTLVALSAFVAISAMILLPADGAFFCVIVSFGVGLIGLSRITSLALTELRGRQEEIRTTQRKYEWMTRHRLEVEVEEVKFGATGDLESRTLTRRSSTLMSGRVGQ